MPSGMKEISGDAVKPTGGSGITVRGCPGCSAVVSVGVLGTPGRGFDSRHPDSRPPDS